MRIRLCALAALLISGTVYAQAKPDALLSVDRNRITVIDRIMRDTGHNVARAQGWSLVQMRDVLNGLRADELLAASLAANSDGLRDVIASANARSDNGSGEKTSAKALGDAADDVVYTPVTPCRLVETRGTFPAVYQGDGSPSHTPVPFAPNEIRTYTLQGGNGVCTSLPGSLAAVQLQVFGIPTTAASGDIEILPQGSAFGSTATMVYVGSIAFNTVSTAAKVNTTNNQISVQVRGGGAHLAMDVVGYFSLPSNFGGNSRSGAYTALAGGTGNAVFADYATVGGGFANQAQGPYSFIGGGTGNLATGGVSTIGGGQNNVASGPYSTVLGGFGNVTSGNYSVATGFQANARDHFTFVWSGWSGGAPGPTFRPNSFQISGDGGLDVEYGSRRADGGGTSWVLISNAIAGQAIATSTGGYLSAGGVWTNNSDRARKTAIEPIDPNSVLRAVASLPITSWRYLDEDPTVRHIGPMAQDFHAAVGYGPDNKSIGTVDADGVALAAIQALNAKLERQERELRKVRAEVARLKKAANGE